MNQEFQKRVHQENVERILKEGIFDDLLHKRLKLAEGKECPLCIKVEREYKGKLRMKTGPYGDFLSCDRYPECRFTWNTPVVENEVLEYAK